jgi:hypothetical protein
MNDPTAPTRAEPTQGGIGRRGLLGAAAGLGLGGLSAEGVAQQPVPIEILVGNPTVGPTLKPILEEEANVRITEGAFQSSTDTVSRLAAPGGTARYDMMGSTYDFSRPVVMGERAGQEKVQPFDMSLIPNFRHLAEASRAGIGERDG